MIRTILASVALLVLVGVASSTPPQGKRPQVGSGQLGSKIQGVAGNLNPQQKAQVLQNIQQNGGPGAVRDRIQNRDKKLPGKN